MYALRHSSIVRMLKRNVPIRLVASLHNTSTEMIEKHYSKYITEHSDESRATRCCTYRPPPTTWSHWCGDRRDFDTKPLGTHVVRLEARCPEA